MPSHPTSLGSITYLLTYSMVQSPSWEANWFAASQEIPRISRNPKIHYRTHKCPQPVPILGQPFQSIYPHPTSWRSILILSTHLRLDLPSGLLPSGFPTKIHPNIIHPSTPRSPQWSPSLQFPHQDPIHPPLLTHMRHMPSSSHTVHNIMIIK